MKHEKLTIIMLQFLNTGAEQYDLGNIELSKAKVLYRYALGAFQDAAPGDYSLSMVGNSLKLNITNAAIRDGVEAFQIIYEATFDASEYLTVLPELSILVDKYNQLVQDVSDLFLFTTKHAYIADEKNDIKILPALQEETFWYKDKNGQINLKKLDYLKTQYEEYSVAVVQFLRNYLDNTVYPEIQGVVDMMTSTVNATFAAVKVDINDYAELIKQAISRQGTDAGTLAEALIEARGEAEYKKLATALLKYAQSIGKPTIDGLPVYVVEHLNSDEKHITTTEKNKINKIKIEKSVTELSLSADYSEGDIVQVLGNKIAGDGYKHLRKITTENDGSGVLLKNGLYACIEDSEEKVSNVIFGITSNAIDDVPSLKSFLNYCANKKKIAVIEGTWIIGVDPTLTDQYKGGLKIPSNLTIEMKNTPIFKGTGTQPIWTRLFDMTSKENIKIFGHWEIDGSYDKLITNGVETNEHMANIFFFNSKNIYIESVYSYNSRGDNIQISGSGSSNCSDFIKIGKFRGRYSGRKCFVVEAVNNLFVDVMELDNRQPDGRYDNTFDYEPFNMLLTDTKEYFCRIGNMISYGGIDLTNGDVEWKARNFKIEWGSATIYTNNTVGLQSYGSNMKFGELTIRNMATTPDTTLAISSTYGMHLEAEQLKTFNFINVADCRASNGAVPTMKVGSWYNSNFSDGRLINSWGGNFDIGYIKTTKTLIYNNYAVGKCFTRLGLINSLETPTTGHVFIFGDYPASARKNHVVIGSIYTEGLTADTSSATSLFRLDNSGGMSNLTIGSYQDKTGRTLYTLGNGQNTQQGVNPKLVYPISTTLATGATTYDTDITRLLLKDGNEFIDVAGKLVGKNSTTANLPSSGICVGFCIFDTTRKKPLWWSGTAWVDSTGTIV